MSEALRELDDMGIDAAGVSPDPPKRNKSFDEKHGLGFRLLSDEDRAVARKYGAVKMKTMRGVTKEGILRSAFLVGEDGKLLGVKYNVKPEATVPFALEALPED